MSIKVINTFQHPLHKSTAWWIEAAVITKMIQETGISIGLPCKGSTCNNLKIGHFYIMRVYGIQLTVTVNN